ncbi:rCG63525 [Rattus norvegicus]|uniref:RCG63525 n=1 Tax=Rattus norvegicus TaxID=10116 RepID=A6J9S5_RAT|nr:rCG63525 [Rattus norvegicus]
MYFEYFACSTCIQYTGRPEESIRFPETGVASTP